MFKSLYSYYLVKCAQDCVWQFNRNLAGGGQNSTVSDGSGLVPLRKIEINLREIHGTLANTSQAINLKPLNT